MQITPLHAWDLTPQEAIALQNRLRRLVVLEDYLSEVRHIGGVDLSFARDSDQGWAGVVILQMPELTLIESQTVTGPVPFPYIPGLLSFRELPLLLQALERVEHTPDVILCDGQGIAHPRGLGIASHLGLFLNLPTVGVAKSRLTGYYREPDPLPGSYTHLYDRQGRVIGAVLRTKPRTKPLFISPGHRITLATALTLVMQSLRGFKLPEPIRQAHQLVNRARRSAL
ncbi:MAG: deoxyribonuclease V [Nitrospinota bacterium]|nr:MAG: deoxyribonuclease V [Nitrospinota bacterium]